MPTLLIDNHFYIANASTLHICKHNGESIHFSMKDGGGYSKKALHSWQEAKPFIDEIGQNKSIISVFLNGQQSQELLNISSAAKADSSQQAIALELKSKWFHLKADTGIQFQYLRQKHLSNSLSLEHIDENLKENGLPIGDSIFSKQASKALCIQSADCIPIFLYSKNPDQAYPIAALHASWRTVVNGILDSTLHALVETGKIQTKNLYALLGPCIQAHCYPVKEGLINEFRVLLKKENLAEGDFFYTRSFQAPGSQAKDLVFFNLAKLCTAVLKKRGLEKIFQSPICSKCHSNFFSFRENASRLRNISFIVQTKLQNAAK